MSTWRDGQSEKDRRHRQKERKIDREANRQIDRQRSKPIDREANRQIDRQKDRQINILREKQRGKQKNTWLVDYIKLQLRVSSEFCGLLYSKILGL